MDKKGHWYTDKNGNHYFVEEGQSPKEGWEQSKRRKMISGGKYIVDEGDGSEPREATKEEYDGYEADESEFDETVDDDFGFDEEEETGGQRRIRPDGQTEIRKSPDAPWEEVSREEYDETGYEDVDYEDEPDEESKPDEEDKAVNESAPYKPVHEYEDFEDARYYPTKSNTDENGKWIGKHYSVAEAHGLTDDNDTPEEFNKRFKHVGKTKDGADIFQGPDGYFSGNPRVNSMAFKTKEALQEYMENLYGKYAYAGFNDSDPRSTGPEAYKKARMGTDESAGVSDDGNKDFKVGDSWNWPAGDFVVIEEEKDGKYKIDSPAIRHGLSKEEWLTKDELNSRIKGSRKVINGLNPWHGKGAEYYEKKPGDSKTGTEVFENLKNYVGKLSDDEKEMLLDLLKHPRKE